MAVMNELLCLGEKKEEQELMVRFEHFFVKRRLWKTLQIFVARYRNRVWEKACNLRVNSEDTLSNQKKGR